MRRFNKQGFAVLETVGEMRLKMNAVQEILQEPPELFCLTVLSYKTESCPSGLMIHLFTMEEVSCLFFLVCFLGPGTFQSADEQLVYLFEVINK